MVDKELIDVLTDFRNDIKADMTNFKNEIRADMANFKDEIRTDMANFKDEINTKFDNLAIELQSIKNTVTIIEKEHGEKLAILLDYASSNIEKHEVYDKKFEVTESKLFEHDVRIAVIKDYIEKCKKSKGKDQSIC